MPGDDERGAHKKKVPDSLPGEELKNKNGQGFDWPLLKKARKPVGERPTAGTLESPGPRCTNRAWGKQVLQKKSGRKRIKGTVLSLSPVPGEQWKEKQNRYFQWGDWEKRCGEEKEYIVKKGP